MADLEGATRSFAFTSGMAALTVAMRLVPSGGHIVTGDDIYGGTPPNPTPNPNPNPTPTPTLTQTLNLTLILTPTLPSNPNQVAPRASSRASHPPRASR